MKGPNAFEMVGDAIPAGDFELGVARDRRGFLQVAFQPGAAVANALRVLPAAGSPCHMSPGESTTALRMERMVERVHVLGPRPLAELLAEIAIVTGEPDLIAYRVEAYSRLDPEIVRALGADHFPAMPLTVIR